MVVWEVNLLSNSAAEDTSGKIYGKLCGVTKAEDFDYSTFTARSGHPAAPADVYYDCSPPSPMLAHNISNLDLDGDGFWIKSEALALQKSLRSLAQQRGRRYLMNV